MSEEASAKGNRMRMEQATANDPLLIVDKIDNPYFGPTSPAEHKVITAIRSLRHDPVGQMFSRKQLDPEQHAAARRWQAYLEAATTSLRSSGHLQEPVDGGGRLPQGVTDRQMEAHKKLIHYAKLLGHDQHHLLVLICEDGLSLWGATAAIFPDDLGPPRRRFVGTWFRNILTILARDMGLGS